MKVFYALLAAVAVASAVPPARKLPQAISAVHPEWRLDDAGYGRIVGGEVVDDHRDFPYIVSLLIDALYLCGGSILSETKVLTAGHCAHNRHRTTVIAGTNWRVNFTGDPNRQIFTNNTLQAHEEYGPLTISNDVGMVTLAEGETFTFNEYVAPIPRASAAVQAGDLLTASGWGATRDDPVHIPAQALHYVENLPAISDDDCQAVYGLAHNWDGIFCTDSSDGRGVCSGDSGGPIVSQATGELVGVNSFVHNAGCESGNPHGYAEVFNFNDWIDAHL